MWTGGASESNHRFAGGAARAPFTTLYTSPSPKASIRDIFKAFQGTSESPKINRTQPSSVRRLQLSWSDRVYRCVPLRDGGGQVCTVIRMPRPTCGNEISRLQPPTLVTADSRVPPSKGATGILGRPQHQLGVWELLVRSPWGLDAGDAGSWAADAPFSRTSQKPNPRTPA